MEKMTIYESCGHMGEEDPEDITTQTNERPMPPTGIKWKSPTEKNEQNEQQTEVKQKPLMPIEFTRKSKKQ